MGTNLTFGQKLREARKKAGLTREELAERLAVSRQAVTKWESGKGLPDVENWKTLSQVLNVSIDYLLDNGEKLDLSVTREEISLADTVGERRPGGRWSKKAARKDSIALERFKGGEIHGLLAKQIPTKSERVIDNVLGFFYGRAVRNSGIFERHEKHRQSVLSREFPRQAVFCYDNRRVYRNTPACRTDNGEEVHYREYEVYGLRNNCKEGRVLNENRS